MGLPIGCCTSTGEGAVAAHGVKSLGSFGSKKSCTIAIRVCAAAAPPSLLTSPAALAFAFATSKSAALRKPSSSES